jgi:hypothetical protein
MKKVALGIAMILVSGGCASTAGPFVTSISSDGDDGLVVEKCMAKFDPWMSTVSNTECRSTNLHLKSSSQKRVNKNAE